MSPEQIEKLHLREKNKLRCFMPFEIQEILGLPTIKEHYEIPEGNDAAQSAHNQTLRGMFRKANLLPVRGDYSVNEVDEIHGFDAKVREAWDNLKIDFSFRLPSSRSRRLVDTL